MSKTFVEVEANDKSRRLYKNAICLSIFSFGVGVLMTLLLFKNSYKLDLTFLSKESVLNGKRIISSMAKENRFRGEISISHYHEKTHEYLSKFRCTGSENDIDAWEERLCIFSKLCYNVDNDRFYYFRSNENKAKPIFYDSSKGMLFEFSKNVSYTKFLSLSSGGSMPWSPIVVNQSERLKNFTILHQFHSLMQTYLSVDNIAHGLWDDFGSISYSMERLNVVDPNLVVMHLTEIPNTTLFMTYHKYVLPALTKHPLVQFKNYVKSFQRQYVCFENLIVGGQLSVFPQVRIKENHGREALFYNWRSKIIKYNGFDPNYLPEKHHIILTNKSDSYWTHSNAKRHRAIVNLEQMEQFLRLNYPTISLEVIQWHTIPFNKQIEKLLNTTILITPCGGVSMIIPMLPHGAHAIVMDFYVNVASHGFKLGQSGSMEGAFLNHIPHVRKQYYQIYGPQDYEFDYPRAKNTRESASIIVNMSRLQLLIDKALQEMQP